KGNDTIIGGRDDDLIYGGDGDDIIDGFSGNDEIHGGDGNDSITGGGGDDTLYGDGGDDTISGGNNVDFIDGGDGDDTITAGARDDTVYGGDGNDTVYGEDGDDFIDTSAPLSSAPLPDRGYPGLFPSDADPDNDKDFVDGGSGDDTIITGDDDDVIFGGAGNDTINAGFDDDTIDGGDGDDYIVGGEGSDTIDGGDGNDTIYGGLDPIFPDSLNIPDSIDLVQDNGRDVIHGGDGNDTIFGQDDDDVIYGDGGNDVIDGGIDEDEIHGGDGNDIITGGQGVDTLYGDADRDLFLGGNVGDFVDGGATGDDWDTLDLTGAAPAGGSVKVTYTNVDSDGNGFDGFVTFYDNGGGTLGTMDFENIEDVIPCFTPGARIATPKGERLVQDLKPGDKVITRDNGIQEIRWIGEKALTGRDLAKAQHLKPVLIKAGALGQGLPERDMIVSPNHRMLVANDRTALYFEEREVLVAAKHLVNTRGIHALNPMNTTYIHFMFDQHEVVLSDGSWTESFQPGDYTLKGMGNAQRNEIFELFPELKTEDGLKDYTAARKTLKKHEARLLSF
ncbi:Hint domain-containing protein, partial [Actibacterium sp.]|uniref:Hint domain-containing protein n=1 Tax=Actibacterium sp. TaxID=1872125 RepID=UPI00356A4DA6